MGYDVKGNWKPHKKQEEFLSIPFSIKEAAYLGGAGSAKSETLLMFPLVHRLHEAAGFKQVFMRRTYPELEREIIPRAKGMYRPFNAKYNGQQKTFEFPSGALIFMGHCENEDDVHKYDSMEINLWTPDEITSFTEFIYLYIGLQRTRAAKDSGLPGIIRCAGMPGNIGHTWVKKRFVDPCPRGGTIIRGRGGIKRIMIFATQADNPYIDPTYKQSLQGLPEAEKQAKLFGSFDAYLGQVFDEFRDRQYPDEPGNALHVIEPIKIPEWWPKLVIGDWGFAAMTWIGFAAISPDRRVYIYRELAFQKTKIEEWCHALKPFIDNENPRTIKFCKSAGQDRGQEHTIQQQIEDALKRPIELTNNQPGSRVAGKLLLHEYLRWKVKVAHEQTSITNYDEERAQWLLRNRGIKEYESYLASFLPPEIESNLPKLQIFNTCPLLITAIKTCTYAKPGKDGKPVEDVAEFEGDDPYDGIRYIVDAAERYFEDSASEFEVVKRREEIDSMLKSQVVDMTSYYHRARLIDLKGRGPSSVSRYHRKRA